MTPRERLAAAMAHQPIDRVPVMCQMAIGHICLNTGCSPVELWHDTDTYVTALFAMCERYGFDGILVSVPGSSPDWRDQVATMETTRDGQIVSWKRALENHSPYPLGVRTLYRADDLPAPLEGHRLATLDTLDPSAIDVLGDVPEWMLAPLRETIRRSAGELSVHGETFSPFDKLVELLGIEPAMVGLIDDAEKCHAVLERGLEYASNWGTAQVRCGIDAIKISSPYVGGGLLSRRFYREFVVPYERRLVERLHAAGPVPVYTHTCGAIGDRLEDMVSTGIDGLECLDPPPLGDVELDDAKRRVGGHVFIKGNVDSVNTLLKRQPAQIETDVRRTIAMGAPGGGFILSTACSIAPGVPTEHVRVLAVVARGASPR